MAAQQLIDMQLQQQMKEAMKKKIEAKLLIVFLLQRQAQQMTAALANPAPMHTAPFTTKVDRRAETLSASLHTYVQYYLAKISVWPRLFPSDFIGALKFSKCCITKIGPLYFAGDAVFLINLTLPGLTRKWPVKDVKDFLCPRYKVQSFPSRHKILKQLQKKTKNKAQNSNALAGRHPPLDARIEHTPPYENFKWDPLFSSPGDRPLHLPYTLEQANAPAAFPANPAAHWPHPSCLETQTALPQSTPLSRCLSSTTLTSTDRARSWFSRDASGTPVECIVLPEPSGSKTVSQRKGEHACSTYSCNLLKGNNPTPAPTPAPPTAEALLGGKKSTTLRSVRRLSRRQTTQAATRKNEPIMPDQMELAVIARLSTSASTGRPCRYPTTPPQRWRTLPLSYWHQHCIDVQLKEEFRPVYKIPLTSFLALQSRLRGQYALLRPRATNEWNNLRYLDHFTDINAYPAEVQFINT
ncbi:hypothetical protein BDK51DRAFT_46435 [Blyttiomyces helicus]|uniref:Uncharacterized protein n=1 Tax=Blyttiomyces helicus TaxID=388810 RepID=A0A4P9WFV1_9FUNG|nr:hypothetical protein BDK51DRAFT_46435 [Blyttiomyces helicus]|eukprot:RKO91671.1 hypothetical protein BDK51DRAFT_46435 [Blyttiomyces helicus]